jgi:uncharacterized DUF497 family protein
LDVHKKSVSYCVKRGDGQIVEEGKLPATREALRQWALERNEPWQAAMEATQTLDGRLAFVVFRRLSRGLIRVVTARDMDDSERRLFRRK